MKVFKKSKLPINKVFVSFILFIVIFTIFLAKNTLVNACECGVCTHPGPGGMGNLPVCCSCDGGGESSCFLAGTKITMSDGTKKNIEEVKIGDSILSFDQSTGQTKPYKVLELESPIRDHHYEITLDNGTVLKVTSEHPLYTKSKYQEAWAAIDPKETLRQDKMKVKKLSVGDYLKTEENTWVQILSMKYIPGNVQTYNLKSVEGTYSFFADGIWAHNKNEPKGAIDVVNCQELAGWACDYSCASGGCNTKIVIYKHVLPSRLRDDSDSKISVKLDNCNSCSYWDWWPTNYDVIYCGRCPGNCSSSKCRFGYAFEKVAEFYATNDRPDLSVVEDCRGTINHGFSIPLPEGLKDGQHNRFFFIAMNQLGGVADTPLGGFKPFELTCAAPTSTPTPAPTSTPTPTPTPIPNCPRGSFVSPSNNACSGRNLSLSPSYVLPWINRIQVVVDDSTPVTEGDWIWNGEEFLWTLSNCNSGWGVFNTYSSCTINSTGTYYWGLRTKNTDPSICSVPDPHNFAPNRAIRVDASAPTHTQATATYNESTEQVTFSWGSGDVGCGGCSSKACAYWLQGKWTDEISGEDIEWFINSGLWTPASYISPSYSSGLSCTGHEGLTAKLLIRQARDSKSNYSSDLGENFSIAGTFTCPAPPPSLGNLYIDADGTAESVKGETYGFSGSREDDDDSPYYIKGSNTYNYMVTSQEVDSNISGSVENIGLSGVIFATTSEPADLLDAMTKVDDNDGFIALFANKNVTVAGKSFSKYKYYYYAKNSSGNYVWESKGICDPYQVSQKIQLEAKKIDAIENCQLGGYDEAAISPYFKVTLYKGLTASENREYGTYAYVYDYYNQDEIMVSKDPTVFP